MEANKYAWQTTPHNCDAPSDKGFYSSCDAAGQCMQNTTEKIGGYGPEGSQVDTNRPFHVKHVVTESEGKAVKFETFFSQDGRTVSMGSDCGYTAGMSC